MKLVLLESPYAGDAGVIERNVDYGRRCLRDSIMRGEAPMASHLLYTQPDRTAELEAALKAENESMKRDQWQPIETAPKDGTVIDLWHKEFGRFPGCSWGHPIHCCGEIGSLCDSDWHSLPEGWVDEYNEPQHLHDFTHWMPLPKPPVIDAAILQGEQG